MIRRYLFAAAVLSNNYVKADARSKWPLSKSLKTEAVKKRQAERKKEGKIDDKPHENSPQLRKGNAH